MRCGTRFQSRSCPRNCRRRARATLPLGPTPGKAVTGGDPRARRPAVDSVVTRAGCLGGGSIATKHPVGAIALWSGTGDFYRTAESDRCRGIHRRCDCVRLHYLPICRRRRERTATRRNPGSGDGASCRRQRRRDPAGAVLGQLHARLERRCALQWLVDLCVRRP